MEPLLVGLAFLLVPFGIAFAAVGGRAVLAGWVAHHDSMSRKEFIRR